VALKLEAQVKLDVADVAEVAGGDRWPGAGGDWHGAERVGDWLLDARVIPVSNSGRGQGGEEYRLLGISGKRL
jgi:hypothetical protein